MRIAITNWSRRKVGGVETYLSSVIPELLGRGHEIGFLHEVDAPSDRELIPLPADVPTWCVADSGVNYALGAVRRWQPDLIYAHGLLDPGLEAATIEIAPAIFFAHSYYGTCISGHKTLKRPVVTPCQHRFGPGCLAHYYPNRCGGLSPVSMLREYGRQSRRLGLMAQYRAIVTHSGHMRGEYIRHGLEPERVFELIYYVRQKQQALPAAVGQPTPCQAASAADLDAPGEQAASEWRLLFLGRMDALKGGLTLLEALPEVGASLGKPLRVTFAGDGPDRRLWERAAETVRAQHPGVRVDFTGWVKGPQLDALLDDSDLLVVPSLWPEPFGLVGPEAGLHGVPVAAFAVGGIPDWLNDGVNGYLADGDPPTASALAGAIIKCLGDPARYAGLRRGALEMARRFSMKNHLAALDEVFGTVLGAAPRLPALHPRAGIDASREQRAR